MRVPDVQESHFLFVGILAANAVREPIGQRVYLDLHLLLGSYSQVESVRKGLGAAFFGPVS